MRGANMNAKKEEGMIKVKPFSKKDKKEALVYQAITNSVMMQKRMSEAMRRVTKAFLMYGYADIQDAIDASRKNYPTGVFGGAE